MKKMRTILILALIASLGILLSGRAAASQQTAGELFEKALYVEEGQGDLQKAIEIYQDLLKRFPENREIAAKAQLHIGLCFEKLGTKEAEKAFQKVVDNYPEQSDAVREAKAKLSLLLRSRALVKTGAAELSLRQVWSGPEVDILGAVSPDGRYLSYVDWVAGDLAIKELATGTCRRLTNNGPWTQSSEFALFSKWSPDSRRIVYQWWAKGEIYELRVIDINDPTPRVLYRDPEKEDYLHPFDWTPDGRAVLAGTFKLENSRAETITQLSLISVADGSVKVLKNFFEGPSPVDPKPWGFVFSPDGKYIAYDLPMDNKDGERDIYLLPVEGGTGIPLIKHPAGDTVIDWSPDGDGLLFSSDRTGTKDVWFIRIGGGKPLGSPHLVKSGVGQILSLGVTARREMYYGLPGYSTDVYEVGIDARTGRILRPAEKTALRNEGHNAYPDYSPDGKQLAYIFSPTVTGIQSGQVLGIRSLETGRVRELILDLASFGYPRWAPDGRSISVEGIGKDRRLGIFRVDVQTSAVVPIVLVEKGTSIFSHRWSKDGLTMFYAAGDPEGKACSVYVHNFQTGRDDPLSGSPSDAHDIDISPDGKWLALINRGNAGKKRTIRIMPTSGGISREIYGFEYEGNAVISPAWSADGRYVFFSKLEKPDGEIWDLYRVSADRGEAQKIDVAMAGFRHLSVHPDGQKLSFSSRGVNPRHNELWVMENFLPGRSAVPEKGPEEISIRKVWDSAIDSNFTGAPSPDGKYLTYVDWDNFANLGIRNLAAGESRLLTDNKSWETGEMCYQSVFSPDGNRIAYSWQTKEGPVQLRIIGIDGSGSRVLRDGKDTKSQQLAAWSQDGRQILGYRFGADRTIEIFLASVDDGTVKPVKTLSGLGAVSIKLCLSPDARYIAYSRPLPQNMANVDIYIVAADGSREIPLVSHPAEDEVLGWEPDGKRLLFKSDRTGSVGIWAIPVAEGKPQGEPQLLKSDMGGFHPMGLTRDGRLFYGLYSGWSDIFVASLDPETGKILAPPAKVIRQNEGLNSAPDWSPDGEVLACRTSRGIGGTGGVALFLHSLRTGVTRELALKKTGGLNYHFLRWSPDGRRILGIGSDEKGSYGALHAIDAQTGDSEIIARSDDRGFLFACEWAPDGKSVYFIRRGEKDRSLIRHELATGAEVSLLRLPNSGRFWFALSPDGRQAALATQDKLRLYSTAGGEPRDLAEAKEATTIAWTRDGKYILYALLRKGSKDINDIWRVPSGGGEAQKLDLGMVNLMHLRVHPDGRRIAFTASERPEKAEIWVMQNFLPSGKK